MKRASNQIDGPGRERIAQAVAQAEANTSAEIVPVLATSSGRYDRGEDICGLWVGIFALAVVWWLLPTGQASTGPWHTSSPSLAHLAFLIVALIGGFVLGVAIASRTGLLKLLFTSRAEVADEVDRRARTTFFDSRVHHTSGSTGLLLYVSLLERRAAVVGDQTVVETLGQAKLDAICHELTHKLSTGSLVDAFAATIHSAGEQLGAVLPRATDDQNELSDALVILDSP